MFQKKNTRKIIFILSFALLIFIGYLFFSYWQWRKEAKAVSAMPWQDGGVITMVREPCIWDTPCAAGLCPPCAVSCPLVSAAYGPACVNFIELDTVSQHGTPFIAAPLTQVYLGGGTHPVDGMQYLAGGASPAHPWVIAIPGPLASRLEKVKDFFIALFKEQLNEFIKTI